MAKRKQNSFTFEIGDDFVPMFIEFQKAASADQRSVAAMLRFLIKEYMEKYQGGLTHDRN